MSQKTISVGTVGTPVDLDVNFGNAQDNFTELYTKNTSQDAAIALKADALTSDQNYVSDAQLVVIGNTSGTNTGDQTLPTTLADLSADATHRLVTDTEKSTWSGKQDALTAASQAEMEAGTETAIRSMSPLRVKQAIDALGGEGGSMTYPGTGIPNSTGSAWGTSYALDTDISSTSASDDSIPSAKAVKTYVDATVAGAGGYTDEMAQDAIGAMVTGNTETGIAVTYDDATAKLNFVVDFSGVSGLTSLPTADNQILQATGEGTYAWSSTLEGLINDAGTTTSDVLSAAEIDDRIAAVAPGTDQNYVSDAQLVVIGNTSGTNTGDQTSVSGNAGTVTNATFTTALTVNTGAVALVGNAGGASQITIPNGTANLAVGTMATLAGAETLTNKTIGSGSVVPVVLTIAASDEDTAITAGAGKRTFRAPFAFTLTGVRASVKTAPTGANIIIDVNETGTTSVLATKITIEADEKTSVTATTQPVVGDPTIADDADMSIDFDQVGSTVAGTGVKVTLYGTRVMP